MQVGGRVAGQFCVFGMPEASELRQKCKFIHEAAISFISGSLSMNQQSHSLFTRPRDLALLCHILLSCNNPARQSYFLFRLEAFFATFNTLYNIFNFRKIDIVKEVCWSSRVPYCFPYPPPSSFPVSAGLQAAGQARMGKGQGPTDLALWNEARRRRPCRSLHTTLHKYILQLRKTYFLIPRNTFAIWRLEEEGPAVHCTVHTLLSSAFCIALLYSILQRLQCVGVSALSPTKEQSHAMTTDH